MKQLFITATDTDAGKTVFASALIRELTKQYRVGAYKPLSAGCEDIDGNLINDDAYQLQQAANIGQSVQSVNPIAYQEAIAPHIAAAKYGDTLDIECINQGLSAIKYLKPEIIITEGAGGWRLPLGDDRYLSDFVRQQSMDVILVVGMKLGCLNHALLTYQAIKADGLNVIGWVANQISEHPMAYHQENIAHLSLSINAPLLATIPYLNEPNQAGQFIELSKLNCTH
ncbi:dethiobiotin synthase [Thalassotalea maritima]|uniref:dethiobiotin synthase n=1 Tax=Thalassotalea maritima TaxID=3242416 RepID=UPI003527205E